MDVESRQQCELMRELQHRTGPRMRMQVSLPPLQQTPSPWWLKHKTMLDRVLGEQR